MRVANEFVGNGNLKTIIIGAKRYFKNTKILVGNDISKTQNYWWGKSLWKGVKNRTNLKSHSTLQSDTANEIFGGNNVRRINEAAKTQLSKKRKLAQSSEELKQNQSIF